MRTLIVGLLALVAISTFAELPYVGDLPQFRVNNLSILWDAPTNQLGASLWVYKVVPQTFPVKAVNYLLSLGGFTNRITVPQGLSVANKSNTCNLVVIPEQGYVRYWNLFAAANHWDRTNHLVERVIGLPKTNEVEKLGLRVLKQFGIQRKELAQRTDGHLITFGENKTRGYYDRGTGHYIDDEVMTRGIFFSRRIDGVNFLGIGVRGGCEVEFANKAKISEINLIWRNYKRYEQYKVASPEAIEHFILSNKSILTKKNFVNSIEVKSLIITGIEPAYIGANEFEKQDYLYPFAKVEATAKMGTNDVGISLYCPILTTNRVK